jgi:hypothetical protein
MARHLFFAITLIGTGVLLNSPAEAVTAAWSDACRFSWVTPPQLWLIVSVDSFSAHRPNALWQVNDPEGCSSGHGEIFVERR